MNPAKQFHIALIMHGGREWMGGVEYIRNLILALANQPEDIRSTFDISLVCPPTIDPVLHSELQPHLRRTYYYEKDFAQRTLVNRALWQYKRVALKRYNPKYDELVDRERFDFAFPHLDVRPNSRRSAHWIPDFQHKHLPHFFPESDIHKRDWMDSMAAYKAARVVFSSHAAKTDFQTFYPDATTRTEVLQFKTSPHSLWFEGDPNAVQRQYNLPERFFLISNQFFQHKNHLLVFRALSLLKGAGVYPTVVCTGLVDDYRSPGFAQQIRSAIEDQDLTGQVHLLGLIPRLDQIQLMRQSLAVIQPSLFEGWSTVMEDARCLGRPIIASDLPVNIEQSPPDCVYFPRESPEALAARMQEWWESKSPGPDMGRELAAREQNKRDVQGYGQRFLEIARGNG